MQNTKTKVTYFKVPADFADQRIDNFLVTRLKGVPKSHVYRILRKGEVRVNKKRIEPSYRLQEDDEIRLPPIRLDDKPIVHAPSQSLAALLEARIIYQDENLMVVNKPSGIPVHGGSKTPMGVIEVLRAMYPKLPHLELVHRLDADTSGCLILAKKRRVLRELHELMRSGKVKKIYSALTQGQWKKEDLYVDAALKKNILSSGERIVRVNDEGKESMTQFKIIETFPMATLVEARLLTGRTHQIRVHAQYRGHPIAGDEKYGDRTFDKIMRTQGLKRLFLHSSLIEFTLPGEKQPMRFEAPLDDDLKRVLATLRLTHP